VLNPANTKLLVVLVNFLQAIPVSVREKRPIPA